MKQVAKEIRTALKEEGWSNRDVSVRCRRDWVIIVETKDEAVDKEKVQQIALREYHKDTHAWLCVQVDNKWLPMPPTTITFDWDRGFVIPTEVATCAGCDTQLTAQAEGWTQVDEERNFWKATEVHTSCETPVEQCNELTRNLIQDDFMRETNAVLEWLNKNYRWQKIE